nr:PREDICTED: uncharacterized protein LOC102350191 [Latimeria chalumnae]|eukprot:XP_014345406.1 PREDICTED: uncharacterized protein LOC102350191 [Latimeria chalumnae]
MYGFVQMAFLIGNAGYLLSLEYKNCGGNIDVSKANNGTIQYSFTSIYSNYSNCTWIIQALPTEDVQITFMPNENSREFNCIFVSFEDKENHICPPKPRDPIIVKGRGKGVITWKPKSSKIDKISLNYFVLVDWCARLATCLNGGTCAVKGARVTCVCPGTWEGENCEKGKKQKITNVHKDQQPHQADRNSFEESPLQAESQQPLFPMSQWTAFYETGASDSVKYSKEMPHGSDIFSFTTLRQKGTAQFSRTRGEPENITSTFATYTESAENERESEKVSKDKENTNTWDFATTQSPFWHLNAITDMSPELKVNVSPEHQTPIVPQPKFLTSNGILIESTTGTDNKTIPLTRLLVSLTSQIQMSWSPKEFLQSGETESDRTLERQTPTYLLESNTQESTVLTKSEANRITSQHFVSDISLPSIGKTYEDDVFGKLEDGVVTDPLLHAVSSTEPKDHTTDFGISSKIIPTSTTQVPITSENSARITTSSNTNFVEKKLKTTAASHILYRDKRLTTVLLSKFMTTSSNRGSRIERTQPVQDKSHFPTSKQDAFQEKPLLTPSNDVPKFDLFITEATSGSQHTEASDLIMTPLNASKELAEGFDRTNTSFYESRHQSQVNSHSDLPSESFPSVSTATGNIAVTEVKETEISGFSNQTGKPFTLTSLSAPMNYNASSASDRLISLVTRSLHEDYSNTTMSNSTYGESIKGRNDNITLSSEHNEIVFTTASSKGVAITPLPDYNRTNSSVNNNVQPAAVTPNVENHTIFASLGLNVNSSLSNLLQKNQSEDFLEIGEGGLTTPNPESSITKNFSSATVMLSTEESDSDMNTVLSLNELWTKTAPTLLTETQKKFVSSAIPSVSFNQRQFTESEKISLRNTVSETTDTATLPILSSTNSNKPRADLENLFSTVLTSSLVPEMTTHSFISELPLEANTVVTMTSEQKETSPDIPITSFSPLITNNEYGSVTSIVLETQTTAVSSTDQTNAVDNITTVPKHNALSTTVNQTEMGSDVFITGGYETKSPSTTTLESTTSAFSFSGWEESSSVIVYNKTPTDMTTLTTLPQTISSTSILMESDTRSDWITVTASATRTRKTYSTSQWKTPTNQLFITDQYITFDPLKALKEEKSTFTPSSNEPFYNRTHNEQSTGTQTNSTNPETVPVSMTQSIFLSSTESNLMTTKATSDQEKTSKLNTDITEEAFTDKVHTTTLSSKTSVKAVTPQTETNPIMQSTRNTAPPYFTSSDKHARKVRIFIMEDQPPVLKAHLISIPSKLVLNMEFIRTMRNPKSLDYQKLIGDFLVKVCECGYECLGSAPLSGSMLFSPRVSSCSANLWSAAPVSMMSPLGGGKSWTPIEAPPLLCKKTSYSSSTRKYRQLGGVGGGCKMTPYYKAIPGFKELRVNRIRKGSVTIEYDAIFYTESVQSQLWNLELVLNMTGLPEDMVSGLRIGNSTLVSIAITDRQLDPCAKGFSCPSGFECISARNKNVSCTSVCHRDYCKNNGICTHERGQEPMCQCPIGNNYWFMGLRCDYKMTRQGLIGTAFGIILSVILLMGAISYFVIRRLKALLIEAKIDQTKSSYRRFNRFDDISARYWSQSWLASSANSLDNPAFSNSEELIHLQMLDDSYCSCQEESGTISNYSQRNTPHVRTVFRHSLQYDWDRSTSSINDHMADSGKASDLSVSSWPMEPIQWTPFPILHQLGIEKPFKARRPRSFCEGMELVTLERSWTA